MLLSSIRIARRLIQGLDVFPVLTLLRDKTNAAQLAPGLNTASDDFRPNVRKDGREIVFDSNRAGGEGMADVYVTTREKLKGNER